MQQRFPINQMTVRGLAGFRIDPMRNCVIITVVGEIDADSALALDQALTTAAGISPCLIIDMTKLEFMDSTGLGTLIEAWRRMREADGGWVSLVHPTRAVRRLLGHAGLQQSFDVYESLAAALTAATEATRQSHHPSV